LFKTAENKTLLIVSVLFALINAVFIYFGILYFLAVPIILLIVWFAIYKLDSLLLFIVFTTPLSILLSEFDRYVPINLSIPAEPLLAGVLLLFIFKIFTGEKLNKKIIFHPVSIAIYFNLFWIFFTTISSTMPVVSVKFLIARLWFIIPLYFVSSHFFSNQNYIKKYFGLYIASLSIVIIYTLSRHIQYGLFEKKVADFVMSPFYKDHTSYGAVLAMYLPVLAGFLFIKFQYKKLRIANIFLLVLFTFALIFSYTRAAWLSIGGIAIVLIIVLLKIKIKYIAIGSLVVGILFFYYQFQITDTLKKNKTDAQENLSDQVTSMTNISTDASNLERINRWNSAIKMFNEKPILGYGPGTYMFNYAPYQMSFDRTIISTNFGDRGNAHSEYIGPLSEQGILGLVSFVLIIIATIYTSINIYYKSKVKETKILSLMALLGLVTYYFHGFLNNFLDTDKLSVPFWGFTAIIVALDVFYLKEEKS
jgi:O-antigen ligase